MENYGPLAGCEGLVTALGGDRVRKQQVTLVHSAGYGIMTVQNALQAGLSAALRRLFAPKRSSYAPSSHAYCEDMMA